MKKYGVKREALWILLGLSVAVLGMALAPTTSAGDKDYTFYGVASPAPGCPVDSICIDWYFTETDAYYGSCCVAVSLEPGERLYSDDPDTKCLRLVTHPPAG